MSAGFKRALRGFIVKTAEKKLTQKLIPPESFTSKDVNTILIICGNERLHEVVLSLPAFKAVCRQFPAAKITALFEGELVALKDQFSICDEVKPFYRKPLSWSIGELVDFMKMLKTGFDFVIVFNTSGHSYFDALLAHFSKAKYILGSELGIPKGEIDYLPYNLLAPVSDKEQHPSEYFRSVLRHIGIKRYHSVNRLPLGKKVKKTAEDVLLYNGIKPNELVVGIALSPENGERTWPIENYVEFARHFSSRIEAKVVIFCNSRDSAIATQVEAGLPFKPFRTDEYNLLEQAALMQYCSLMVCTNIDFMYLAYAVGCPVIGLFGGLEEEFWKPGKDKFIAINSKNEDITTIKTSKVIEAAKTALRAKILNKEKSFDISDQTMDDYLDFGDIVENI